MNFSDVKVVSVTVKFGTTFPTQNFGGIRMDREITAEVKPGQNAAEIEALISEHLQASVRAAIAPIAKRVYETQIAPMLENLPDAMRKDLESKFGAMQTLMAISPELAAAVEGK